MERRTVSGPSFRIGELAQCTGVSTRALRHYEHRGVLAPGRLPNGYRVYDGSAVDRVRRIRFLLGMGLPLDAIHEVSACLDDDVTEVVPCEDLVAVLGRHVQRLERRIETATTHRRRARTFLERTTDRGAGERWRSRPDAA